MRNFREAMGDLVGCCGVNPGACRCSSNPAFHITMLNQMGVLIIFALAYNMLLGQGGMLSFGHAVYFGLAGYTVAHYLNGIGEETLPYLPISLIPQSWAALVGPVFRRADRLSFRRVGQAPPSP